MQKNSIDDIPILEGEEMWAQEAIDKKEKFYRVTYYANNTGSSIRHKDFSTLREAIDFSQGLTGETLEIKLYEK